MGAFEQDGQRARGQALCGARGAPVTPTIAKESPSPSPMLFLTRHTLPGDTPAPCGDPLWPCMTLACLVPTSVE